MWRQLLLMMFMVVSIYSSAQPAYLNTKTPYQPQQKNYTVPPKGYAPVFINYIGRHGARFQTSAEKDVMITDILEKAKKNDALIKDGLVLYKLILDYQIVEKNRYGDITLLGVKEQHDIAQRMQAEYAPVFNNAKLLVEMTEKLRTQQSAKEFLSGLTGCDSASVTSIIFPAKADSILRFYDLSKAYKDYSTSSSIKNHVDSLMQDARTIEAANNVCAKIFKKNFIDSLNGINIKTKGGIGKANVISFSQSLYEVFASMFDAAEELQTNFTDATRLFKTIFSSKDLHWFDEINSASDFYEKGPAENVNGIQITIAAPLLNDLIKTTDSAIRYKKYNAVLRFTHAEAISPLATLMEIPQASTISNSVFDFYNRWHSNEIIPMGANIQLIIYSNRNNYLLKVLLNEKEVALPVATNTFPYYNWNDIKSYYSAKLSNINKN